MKKVFALAFVAAFLMVSVVVNGQVENSNCYPMTTIVVELDYENDLVFCLDFNGNEWVFEGCEDWFENDICTMIMNDNGTDIIYDDIIVDYRYDGWVEGWNELMNS